MNSGSCSQMTPLRKWPIQPNLLSLQSVYVMTMGNLLINQQFIYLVQGLGPYKGGFARNAVSFISFL